MYVCINTNLTIHPFIHSFGMYIDFPNYITLNKRMNLDDIFYHHASFTSIASRSRSSEKENDAKNVDVKFYVKLCVGAKFFTTIDLDSRRSRTKPAFVFGNVEWVDMYRVCIVRILIPIYALRFS